VDSRAAQAAARVPAFADVRARGPEEGLALGHAADADRGRKRVAADHRRLAEAADNPALNQAVLLARPALVEWHRTAGKAEGFAAALLRAHAAVDAIALAGLRIRRAAVGAEQRRGGRPGADEEGGAAPRAVAQSGAVGAQRALHDRADSRRQR
jgi:hypothetical protein